MDEDAEQRAVNAASYVLLFFLVFGLSGTIDLAAFREKFKQVRGRSPAAGEAMPERMALLRHRAAPAAVEEARRGSAAGAGPAAAAGPAEPPRREGCRGTDAGEPTRTSRRPQKTGIVIGIVSQFVLLPMAAFATVRLLSLGPVYGITLLVTASSPGGSYSNWWCSITNSDLSLSVAMTTVSSFVAVFMLPLNMVLYVRTTYSSSVNIDWGSMATALAVVVVSVGCGLYMGEKYKAHRNRINQLGNLSGLALVGLGLGFSSNSNDPIWGREWKFYVATMVPCGFALALSLGLASAARLPKPQRMAVCIETCYQNTGIALAVSLAMFDAEEAPLAAGIPVFYQVCQTVFIIIASVVCWKLDWTYAPASTGLWQTVSQNWQPSAEEEEGGGLQAEDGAGGNGDEGGGPPRAGEGGAANGAPPKAFKASPEPDKGVGGIEIPTIITASSQAVDRGGFHRRTWSQDASDVFARI